MIRAILALIFFATQAHSETIVLGLSQDSVSITATFDGSDILIFGAVSRTAPEPLDKGKSEVHGRARPPGRDDRTVLHDRRVAQFQAGRPRRG